MDSAGFRNIVGVVMLRRLGRPTHAGIIDDAS